MAQDPSSTYDRLHAIIVQKLDGVNLWVGPNSSWAELECDDDELRQIGEAVEKEFGFPVPLGPGSDWMKLRTVQQAVDFIDQYELEISY